MLNNANEDEKVKQVLEAAMGICRLGDRRKWRHQWEIQMELVLPIMRDQYSSFYVDFLTISVIIFESIHHFISFSISSKRLWVFCFVLICFSFFLGERHFTLKIRNNEHPVCADHVEQQFDPCQNKAQRISRYSMLLNHCFGYTQLYF